MESLALKKHDDVGSSSMAIPRGGADTVVDLSNFMSAIRRTPRTIKIRFTSCKPPAASKTPPYIATRAVSTTQYPQSPAHARGTRTFSTQCMRSAMQANGRRDYDEFVTSKDGVKLSEVQLSLEEFCELLHNRIYAFLDSTPENSVLKDVKQQILVTLEIFAQAFEKYTLDELSLSYNGGKDCLVLLVLYLVALHTHLRPSSPTQSNARMPFPASLASVYIQHPNSFFEVDEFVRSSAKQYHLHVASSTLNMKEAFGQYLEAHKNVQAIFVGTRRKDPFASALKHFDPTDHGWPDFMRIHPVIDWQYGQIWAFIRHFEIPYCCLYDEGYTSLGGTKDTFPNPNLAKVNSTDKIHFRPAYELQDDDQERSGRQKRDV